MGFFKNPLKLHKKLFKAGQKVTGGLAKMDPLGSRLRKFDPLGSKLISGAPSRSPGGPMGQAMGERETLGGAFMKRRRRPMGPPTDTY